MNYNVIATTLLGVESVTAGEIERLGYERQLIKISDGQVVLQLNNHEDLKTAVARLNIGLRTAERVLVELASFTAKDFDSLYNSSYSLSWHKWIEKGIEFHVNGYSRKSVLYGIPSCQRIIKKAIVSQLSKYYGLADGQALPEDRNLGLLRIYFSIVSDKVTIMVDTSGDGLHKRGYRPLRHEAPIKETLAAAMLILSRYEMAGAQEAIYDPFCGSGTIPIEAALISSDTAPGLNRSFAAEQWNYIGRNCFDMARKEALGKINKSSPEKIRIFGSDIDAKAVSLAVDNAKRAGVSEWIKFRQQDINNLANENVSQWTNYPYHLIVCNPPYGERLLDDEQAENLYRALAEFTLDENGNARKGIRLSVITPEEQFENIAGGKADKRRKLYNGMIKCTMYHYFKQTVMKKNPDSNGRIG